MLHFMRSPDVYRRLLLAAKAADQMQAITVVANHTGKAVRSPAQTLIDYSIKFRLWVLKRDRFGKIVANSPDDAPSQDASVAA